MLIWTSVFEVSPATFGERATNQDFSEFPATKCQWESGPRNHSGFNVHAISLNHTIRFNLSFVVVYGLKLVLIAVLSWPLTLQPDLGYSVAKCFFLGRYVAMRFQHPFESRRFSDILLRAHAVRALEC